MTNFNIFLFQKQYIFLQSPYASYLTSPGGNLGLMSSAAALCSFGGSLGGQGPLIPSSSLHQQMAMTSSSHTLTSSSPGSHSPLSVAALTSNSKSENDLVRLISRPTLSKYPSRS